MELIISQTDSEANSLKIFHSLNIEFGYENLGSTTVFKVAYNENVQPIIDRMRLYICIVVSYRPVSNISLPMALTKRHIGLTTITCRHI